MQYASSNVLNRPGTYGHYLMHPIMNQLEVTGMVPRFQAAVMYFMMFVSDVVCRNCGLRFLVTCSSAHHLLSLKVCHRTLYSLVITVVSMELLASHTILALRVIPAIPYRNLVQLGTDDEMRLQMQIFNKA